MWRCNMIYKKDANFPYPILTNTSVKLCVKLFDLYKSFSCTDKEKTVSFGSKEITKDLIESIDFDGNGKIEIVNLEFLVNEYFKYLSK